MTLIACGGHTDTQAIHQIQSCSRIRIRFIGIIFSSLFVVIFTSPSTCSIGHLYDRNIIFSSSFFIILYADWELIIRIYADYLTKCNQGINKWSAGLSLKKNIRRKVKHKSTGDLKSH